MHAFARMHDMSFFLYRSHIAMSHALLTLNIQPLCAVALKMPAEGLYKRKDAIARYDDNMYKNTIYM